LIAFDCRISFRREIILTYLGSWMLFMATIIVPIAKNLQQFPMI
jgi:hypothetical protein